jgi:ATP-dependent Clp endopeptidase proteolytic subunit ClpP
MKTDFLQIENRTGRLKLNDGVHKGSADKLIEELDRLYGPSAVAAQMVLGDIVCAADDALESVEVVINSPGGSVFEGQRIYNALRGISSRGVAVTTIVDGLAASMGSVILMAGDERRMNAGSRIMIHEASTMAAGDARSLRKTADLLDGISAEIAGIYAERTGGDEKEIRKQMLAETWMTADEARASGFVHTVVKDGKPKAEFDTEAKSMSIFARIFPNNAEAVAKLEGMLEENETLRADLETAQARVAELTALAEVNAQLQADLADAQAKLAEAETLANENAQTIADLAEQAEVTSEKVAVRAAELLASQGHPAPVELTGDGGETKSALDRFNELTGEEATRFYNLNRKAIIAEQFKSQS